jgi:hypothetical protein
MSGDSHRTIHAGNDECCQTVISPTYSYTTKHLKSGDFFTPFENI